MLEIELKASLEGISPQALESALKKAGFAPGQIKEETDIYYNGNDRDFRKTDEALRLRSSRVLTGEVQSKTFITYKGSKVDSRSQTRPELETSVGDLDVMKELFGKLGYREVMTVRKQRAYYHRENITVCLDEVEGLGRFIELEQVEEDGTAKKEAVIDRLLDLLSSFGVPQSNLLRESYLELLMASATS